MAELCGVDRKLRPVAVPLVNRAVGGLTELAVNAGPALVIRHAAGIEEAPASARTRDDLAPVRGIAAALLLALWFWCVIALLVLW